MSAYRRFISYMYDCRQGQKRKNCGFLKIEVRNNRCLIIFQLKNAPCQNKCNAYLCFRGSDPEYLFLHTIPVHQGNTQFKLETASVHMAGSNFSFSQCCGILCTDENGNNCCTCWDSVGELPAYNPAKQVSSAEESSSNSVTPYEEGAAIEPDIPSNEESTIEPVTLSEEKSVIEPVTPSNEESDIEPVTPSEEDSIVKPKTFSEIWEHMQQEFPALAPFDDNAVVEGIKIAPSDLGYLQSLNLELGSNQFLLHGYKCYQHLFMGRLHGQLQYVIGIPGVYDPQEQFMAKMFGFPCFKPIRECKQKNGQFGYWLRCFRG